MVWNDNDEQEVEAAFAQMAKEFIDKYIGLPIKESVICAMQTECRGMSYRLNQMFGNPKGQYEVVLGMDERLGQLDIGYRVINPERDRELAELTAKYLAGFKGLEPNNGER